MLPRVVRITAGVVSPVVVAARRGDNLTALPAGTLRAEDAVENAGPLAGMAAGLELLSARCDAAFVVSCDHPLLRPAFISRLIARLADHPAVVPVHKGRPYPLVAVYHMDVRETLSAMLDAGELRAQDFVKRCEAMLIPSEGLRDTDPQLDSLRNVNDRESYERALRMRLASAQPSRTLCALQRCLR